MNNNQIHVRAEFNIEKGKIEECKKLIQDMSRIVENNEPDTINYQFYLNRSETKCMSTKHIFLQDCKLSLSNYWILKENTKDYLSL
jgi:hypothetical protein